MRKKASLVMGLALVLGTSAQAAEGRSVYKPPTSGDTASLSFSAGYTSSVGVTGMQTYMLGEEERCESLKRGLKFLWTTPKTQSLKAVADKEMIVSAITRYIILGNVGYAPGGFTIDVDESVFCQSAIKFIPKPGRTYKVRQVAPPATGCAMTVVDDATNEAPPTFKVLHEMQCVFLPRGAYYPSSATTME